MKAEFDAEIAELRGELFAQLNAAVVQIKAKYEKEVATLQRQLAEARAELSKLQVAKCERSETEGFYGLGQEQHHKRIFAFDSDHPEVFASEDKGATPVEYVLVGLASCLTAGIASVAQHRNIQLRSVTATVEGDMDLQGILGIDSDVRNGFGGIKVTYNIDADAKREDIEALVAQSQRRSAVYDVVTNPTNVTVVVNSTNG